MTTALSKVMDWYEAIAEMQFLAKKQLSKEVRLNDSKFIDLSQREIFEKMKEIKIELDDLAIVSLVSVFESMVIDYITIISSQVFNDD
ncbi:hypothetical protein [Bacillus alveayuensis]|jgi:hypothetical protein|uniref:hypothetical protein n=1 Tax=Aeribacillus alveayuensis TaxID=279215 RepID=UPI0005CDB637|nr:hypothetical protein [Bacillus alveayuensis]